MELLTIILPVYNGEKRIARCIESILSQTYENIQLIIINDGSRDRSLSCVQEIKKEYEDRVHAGEKENCKIEIIDKENEGVAITRNLGIQKAQGAYLTFVDQDDYMAEDYCEKMMSEMLSAQADILVAGYQRVSEDGELLYEQKLIDNSWAPYVLSAPWAHIYRTDFLRENHLGFLSAGIGEDVYFNALAYACASKIKVYSYEGYRWVNNLQSVSNTRQVSINEKSDPFVLLKALQEQYKERKMPVTEYREYFLTRYCCWYVLYTLSGSPWKDVKKMERKLFAWLKKNYPLYYKNPYIGGKKPEGDTAVSRWSVCLLVRAKQIKMDLLLLRILHFIVHLK